MVMIPDGHGVQKVVRDLFWLAATHACLERGVRIVERPLADACLLVYRFLVYSASANLGLRICWTGRVREGLHHATVPALTPLRSQSVNVRSSAQGCPPPCSLPAPPAWIGSIGCLLNRKPVELFDEPLTIGLSARVRDENGSSFAIVKDAPEYSSAIVDGGLCYALWMECLL